MKIGLVLEGGGMRGIYTSAILDYFIGTGLEFDGIFSVSAGALFGINLLSKDSYRTLRYNLNYINDKRYVSYKNLITTGNIISENFAFHELPTILDPFDNETFKSSDTDFFVTVTNLETGEAEYFNVEDSHEDVEVLRASGSLPFVSQPVNIDGNLYLDGGIADSIPYKRAMEEGYDKLIVILTQPIQYRKEKPNNLIIDVAYRQYPKFAERLKNRYKEYNQTIDEIKKLEESGDMFVIRPSHSLGIDRLEKDAYKLAGTYRLGLNDIQRLYPDLIDYLKAE